ncbi:hypothetical protein GCM10025777_58820 [Membranihabitans marinus]
MLSLTQVYSQGYFYDLGQNGFTMGANISSNNGTTLFGVEPSYTLNGKLSMGLGLGISDSNDFGSSSTFVGPFINYLVVKQGEKDIPLNVGLGGSFLHSTYKDIDDLTVNIISVHCDISHVVETSYNLKIIPIVGFTWVRSTVNIDDFANISGSALGFSVGGALVIDKFYIAPAIGFSDGESSFVLNFGMNFPQ